MKKVIKEEDKFIVVSESIITSFDRKVITRLYQPLMGSISSSFYLTLLSELEFDNTISKEKHSIKSLLDLMNCSLDDVLLAAKKLEGLGLIKSQYNKTSDFYVFSLFSPLTPKEFFNNPLFDSLLQKQLGEDNYLKNKMYFSKSKISNDELIDISDDFDDVFNFDGTGKYEGGDNCVGKKIGKAKISFNYDAFYAKLNELNISHDLVKDIEDDIALIAIASKTAAVDIASLINKSLDSNNKVNLMKLRNLTSTSSTNTYTPKTVDTGNDRLNKKIDLYNKITPYEFLIVKNNYAPISFSDKKLIDSLLNEYHLTAPVVNVLLDYALQVCDNKLNRSYVEKIAGSLARSKILDALDAMNYLNKSTISTTKQKTEEKPKEEVTDEDIKKALEELEQIKKARDN